MRRAGRSTPGARARRTPRDAPRRSSRTEELLDERLGRELVHESERGEGEALDHDLHAEIGHVPARVGDDVVEQHPQVRVDRVVPGQLRVEVPGEHLYMACLVHHLCRRVVLGVDPGNGLDDLRGADQRALLTVHELRQRPVLRLDPELDPFLVAPRLERRALQVHLPVAVVLERLVRDDDLLLVDVGVPREIVGVPLRRLRLLVELEQRLAALLVVPREDGVACDVTLWATASMSSFETARIASMSSTSARPISSSLVTAIGITSLSGGG